MSHPCNELELWLVSHMDRVAEAFDKDENTKPVWAEEVAAGYDNRVKLRDDMYQRSKNS